MDRVLETVQAMFGSLTCTLLDPKVISLHHQYRARPALFHIRAVWPGSILLTEQLQILILISPKLIKNSSKNVRWTSIFKKYSRLRFNELHNRSPMSVTASTQRICSQTEIFHVKLNKYFLNYVSNHNNL